MNGIQNIVYQKILDNSNKGIATFVVREICNQEPKITPIQFGNAMRYLKRSNKVVCMSRGNRSKSSTYKILNVPQVVPKTTMTSENPIFDTLDKLVIAQSTALAEVVRCIKVSLKNSSTESRIRVLETQVSEMSNFICGMKKAIGGGTNENK